MFGVGEDIDLPKGSWGASPQTSPLPKTFGEKIDEIPTGIAAGWTASQAGPGILNQGYYEGAAYGDIRRALSERGYADRLQAARFAAKPGVLPDERRALLGLLAEERARDPQFLPEFAGISDPDQVRELVRTRRKRDMATSDATYDQVSGAGKAGWWIGALAGGATDPLSYVPFGAGVSRGGALAYRVLGTMGRQAAGNAALQLAAEPFIAHDAKSLGIEWGAREVMIDVGLAAGFGGVLGGAAELGGEMVARIGAHRATREQLDAVHVVEKDVWARSSSPFTSGLDGDRAHGEGLTTALAALDQDLPVPKLSVRPALIAAPGAPAGGLDRGSVVRFVMDDLEGGAKRTVDSGGATRFGISQDAHPGVDVDTLDRAGAERIYIEQYWKPMGLDTADPKLAAVAFDAAINHGVGKAKAMLAQADGSPERLIALRRAEYARLIAADPGQYARYEQGWANRLGKLEARIGTAPLMSADRYRPGELMTDATAMQYKAGGDEQGVTSRLAAVKQWNPLLSGKVIVWEGLDGRRVVADGHQRLGLAKRAQAADPAADIWLDAITLRESDGVTPQQARVWAALKNIAEGSGTSIDAAKVLREAGEQFELPPGGIVRDARALARLGHEAFGAVVNEVIPAEHGAAIARVLPDQPDEQMAMVDLVVATNPASPLQAETIVRQAVLDGFAKAEARAQLSMFGDADRLQSNFLQRARVLEDARRALRRDKTTFRTLVANAGRIEDTGNVLARDANAERLTNADRAIQLITSLANRAGPVRDALLDAVRLYPAAGRRAAAVAHFLDNLGSLDLQAIARGVEAGGPDGGDAARAGRLGHGERPDGGVDGRGEEAELALLDFDATAAPKGIDDPHGPEAAELTAILEHDLRMDLEPTVPQSAADDGPLGPASILTFVPQRGEPGISVINEEGHFATAVFRDAEGKPQGGARMPISPEGRELSNEVSLYVRPEFRRQGIATRLYDALSSAGHRVDELSGSGDLTPDGAAFVSRRRQRSASDPNKAALDRQRTALGAQAPMRPKADQAGHSDLPMFEHVEQPQLFALAEAIEDGDAKPVLRSAEDVLAELDADDAAIAAARECLL